MLSPRWSTVSLQALGYSLVAHDHDQLQPARLWLAEIKAATAAYVAIRQECDEFLATATDVRPTTPAGQEAAWKWQQLEKRRSEIGQAAQELEPAAQTCLEFATESGDRHAAFGLQAEIASAQQALSAASDSASMDSLQVEADRAASRSPYRPAPAWIVSGIAVVLITLFLWSVGQPVGAILPFVFVALLVVTYIRTRG